MSKAQSGGAAGEVGYRRPPRASQFSKGQSGNPGGRPRNRHREIPCDSLLGQMVTIREDGRKRRVTAAEAFILQLTRKGLAGDSAAARASLTAIEAARAKRVDEADVTEIRLVGVGMGVGTSLRNLGLAIKKYPLDEKRVSWALQPWIVEAALARLGSRQLTEEEQREVWNNTRTPDKVDWPKWWMVKGDCGYVS